jgi:hypothetical protein
MIGLGQKLKAMDFYRHVPVDLTEPTAPGAVISVSCACLMVLLFFGEVWSYAAPPGRTDMFVAQDHSGVKLRFNFNMTFHKLPCFLTSLDVLDALGRHEVGTSRTVTHTRVSAAGDPMHEFDEATNPNDYNQMLHEGCNLVGYILVNKVPGNFHVSSHGKQQLVMQYAVGGNINVEHTVHDLWVGHLELRGDHGYDGEVHPINGLVHRDGDAVQHYEYHIDVVPTVFARKRGKGEEHAYQLSVNTHKQDVPLGHMPAAFFRYQLSPITVRFGHDSVSFLHFLTYVCAIVGGVFTVAGLLNGAVQKAAVQFQRNVLGKQS